MSRRFFVDSKTFQKGSVMRLSSPDYADELKHLVKVLRYAVGDEIQLTNGRGLEARVRIRRLSREEAELEILECTEKKRSGPELNLCQSVLKGPKMDWLVEKATELGVRAIIPILSERTVGMEENSKNKVERWKRISTSAVKQSGSGFLLRIGESVVLENFQAPESGACIVLEPDPTARPLFALAQDLARKKDLREVYLFIGPEGGWSNEELALMHSRGFYFAHLGENILRGETAAICSAGIVLHAFDFPAL